MIGMYPIKIRFDSEQDAMLDAQRTQSRADELEYENSHLRRDVDTLTDDVRKLIRRCQEQEILIRNQEVLIKKMEEKYRDEAESQHG